MRPITVRNLRIIVLNPLVALIIILLGACSGRTAKPALQLTYLDYFDIRYKTAGLREPSGLALSYEKDALWTISDDKKRIFQLTFQGDLQKDSLFDIPDEGLEGIALQPGGEFLFMVQEEKNEIIKINVATRAVADRRRLADMADYTVVADYLASGGSNKGLEGITWNSASDTLFVMKEGVPGLLLEVSPDLNTILNHKLLNAQNGFRDNDVFEEKLDFSGIDYDHKRSLFWIVSDKGQRLFLYDWNSNRVRQTTALSYRSNGVYHEIAKAEGVAIDPDTDRLHVVSDAEARLYIFDVQIK